MFEHRFRLTACGKRGLAPSPLTPALPTMPSCEVPVPFCRPFWRNLAGASALLIGLIAVVAAQAEPPRPTVSLDGVWQFRLDPDDVGVKEKWPATDAAALPDQITVPGAWDAQGFGKETDKLHHNHVGKAWYRRQVTIPADWAGKRIHLCVGGVHRYADTWVNGKHLDEHIGYLSPVDLDVTEAVKPGEAATMAIRVDSKQRWEVDALTGCFDIIDEMFTDWGGIWGHVWLEARAPAWLRDLHVQTRISPTGCTVSADVAGEASGWDAARLDILAGDRAAATRDLPRSEAAGDGNGLKISVDMPDAKLWTPETPNLYTARLTLLREGKPFDAAESRFGLREIKVDGCHFTLNGKRLFLRGYGDDAIYPETMAAPSEKEPYLKKLRFAKEFGFNFVRHHSHILPPEYYDAADEVGMLVSAEFPIAYQQYYDRAKGAALELYKTEWAAAIKRLRNHPSIFDWCMGNELYRGVPLAPELYRIAKFLDPQRLVIDSDGLGGNFLSGKDDRATLDFFSVQFSLATPLEEPGKYGFETTPKKPVIDHETGNYATFPRMDAIEAFRHNFKPFWLTPARDKLKKLGLLDEAAQWSRNSEQLYVLSHKTNLEGLRRNPRMAGYTWWLLQDYWTGSNGIVDHYFRAKQVDAAKVRQFNSDVVLLLDGLDVTCRSGQPLNLKMRVSNYSPDDLRQVRVTCQVRVAGRLIGPPDGRKAVPVARQGELTDLGGFSAELPAVTGPERLTVAVRLTAGGKTYGNDWSSWVYPARIEPPTLALPVYAAPELGDQLRGCGAKPLASGPAGAEPALMVVAEPTAAIVRAAAEGARVLCLNPQLVFLSIPNRFKPAWWVGSATDCNIGTAISDHPLVKPLAPNDWAEAGWLHLLDGSQAYVLDDWPAQPEVLVRAIDVHTTCRSKAVLLQARLGKGAIYICGLNLGNAERRRPEQQWLLDRLLEHAAGGALPKAELPADWLQKRIEAEGLPEGAVLRGFARLTKNDGETTQYADHHGGTSTIYVCRQTAKGHRITWETEPVPVSTQAKEVSFVFTGGLGWRSEPKREGFTLLVNDHEALRFDVTTEKVSHSKDGTVTLAFVPKRHLPEDSLGLFCLTVGTDKLKPGEPCRIAVESRSEGSRRWFGVNP